MLVTQGRDARGAKARWWCVRLSAVRMLGASFSGVHASRIVEERPPLNSPRPTTRRPTARHASTCGWKEIPSGCRRLRWRNYGVAMRRSSRDIFATRLRRVRSARAICKNANCKCRSPRYLLRPEPDPLRPLCRRASAGHRPDPESTHGSMVWPVSSATWIRRCLASRRIRLSRVRRRTCCISWSRITRSRTATSVASP